MEIKIYNTLSHQKEIFLPLDSNHIKVYVCGPTVYDCIHIGNARSLIVFDVLVRLLKSIYPKVTYVRNITDVDDKIINRSKELNISNQELVDITIDQFYKDSILLNLLLPDFEPRATENINEIIHFIQNIIQNGYGYISNGYVLFDIDKLSDYGKFSRQNLSNIIAGARVDVASYKKNPLDFILWKPSLNSNEISWHSPWSVGRPGWHIECSTMSHKYLGDEFDIHGGGMDLIFPHHQNEIAQSLAVHNKYPAKYWMHNGFVMLNDQKMSKSTGNIMNLHELMKLDSSYNGDLIRLLMLMTHYRQPLFLSENKLIEAKNILHNWTKSIEKANNKSISNSDLPEVFMLSLADDMNTPQAISIMHQTNDPMLLKKMGIFLGIFDKINNYLEFSEEEKLLIKQRNQARKDKDFHTADIIRNRLISDGIQVIDQINGITDYIKKI